METSAEVQLEWHHTGDSVVTWQVRPHLGFHVINKSHPSFSGKREIMHSLFQAVTFGYHSETLEWAHFCGSFCEPIKFWQNHNQAEKDAKYDFQTKFRCSFIVQWWSKFLDFCVQYCCIPIPLSIVHFWWMHFCWFQIFYPVNVLRNVAMMNAPTDLCFLTDVDFVPCYNCHQRIVAHTKKMKRTKQVFAFLVVVESAQETIFSSFTKNQVVSRATEHFPSGDLSPKALLCWISNISLSTGLCSSSIWILKAKERLLSQKQGRAASVLEAKQPKGQHHQSFPLVSISCCSVKKVVFVKFSFFDGCGLPWWKTQKVASKEQKGSWGNAPCTVPSWCGTPFNIVVLCISLATCRHNALNHGSVSLARQAQIPKKQKTDHLDKRSDQKARLLWTFLRMRGRHS